jgi:hypothetical protein
VSPWRRELLPILRRGLGEARGGVAVTSEAYSDGDLFSERTTAPAKYEWRELAKDRLVEGSLELVRSDGHAYLPYQDYLEDPSGGRWQNLRIPAGQSLTAEYYYEDTVATPSYRFEGSLVRLHEDPATGETVVTIEPRSAEPEVWRPPALQNLWTNVAGYNPAGYYRHGGRVYLRGRITGGTTDVGTALFSTDAGYRPANTESLPARSDAGPVQLEVTPAGVAQIGDGPFVAGSGWLSLDGLSFRAATGYGARYPATNRYPNTDRYPNG